MDYSKRIKRFSIIAAVVFAVWLAVCPDLARASERFVTIGLSAVNGAQSVRIGTNAVSVYQDVNGQPVYSFDSASGFSIVPYGGAVAINGDGGMLALVDAPLIQGIDGITDVNGVKYRGFIKLVPRGNGLLAVNVADAEHYLMGVVPAEMPALWHIEALKAQAVAARSYLWTQAGVHAADGYELCDTIHCQVYKGVSAEHPNSNDAILQTAGVLARYDGQPINAVFFSSSGGATENSENVWTAVVPYMRGVREVAENEFSEWSRSFTMAQLSSALAAKGDNIGQVLSVTIDYRPSGRAARITFVGSAGAKTYEKDAVRGFCSELDGSLRSTMFTVNGYGVSAGSNGSNGSVGSTVGAGSVHVLGAEGTVSKNVSEVYVLGGTGGLTSAATSGLSVTAAGEITRYSAATATHSDLSALSSVTISSDPLVFNGRGYGHGAGMSQYGAKGMAESGYDYVRILKHYYTGIEVY